MDTSQMIDLGLPDLLRRRIRFVDATTEAPMTVEVVDWNIGIAVAQDLAEHLHGHMQTDRALQAHEMWVYSPAGIACLRIEDASIGGFVDFVEMTGGPSQDYIVRLERASTLNLIIDPAISIRNPNWISEVAVCGLDGTPLAIVWSRFVLGVKGLTQCSITVAGSGWCRIIPPSGPSNPTLLSVDALLNPGHSQDVILKVAE
jgi:hypothetical protein